MSLRRVPAEGGGSGNGGRLAEVLSAGIASLSLKPEGVKPADTNMPMVSEGRRESCSSNHKRIQEMGLNLSPFEPNGATGMNPDDGKMMPIQRGRQYLVKRMKGDKGFLCCTSGALGSYPDYMVGFISPGSDYKMIDEYSDFYRQIVQENKGSGALPRVKYSRALPEPFRGETPYTIATDQFSREMVRMASLPTAPNGISTAEYSNGREHAFHNVYLFLALPGQNNALGQGRYISLGRFVALGYEKDRLELQPVPPSAPYRPDSLLIPGIPPPPPLVRPGPPSREELQNNLNLLARAAAAAAAEAGRQRAVAN